MERLEGFAGSIECTGDEREQPAFDDRRQPMEAGRQMEEGMIQLVETIPEFNAVAKEVPGMKPRRLEGDHRVVPPP